MPTLGPHDCPADQPPEAPGVTASVEFSDDGCQITVNDGATWCEWDSTAGAHVESEQHRLDLDVSEDEAFGAL